MSIAKRPSKMNTSVLISIIVNVEQLNESHKLRVDISRGTIVDKTASIINILKLGLHFPNHNAYLYLEDTPLLPTEPAALLREGDKITIYFSDRGYFKERWPPRICTIVQPPPTRVPTRIWVTCEGQEHSTIFLVLPSMSEISQVVKMIVEKLELSPKDPSLGFELVKEGYPLSAGTSAGELYEGQRLMIRNMVDINPPIEMNIDTWNLLESLAQEARAEKAATGK